MAIDTATPRSRRALLTAAVGGAVAATAASLARVSPAEAANGDTVRVGAYHSGTAVTVISSTAPTALHGEAAQHGLLGTSYSGAGLVGSSTVGHGLRVKLGRIRVDEVSGVATIAKGKKSKTVTPGVDINFRTFVLLTPMANIGSRGLWYTKNGANDTITIRMSSPRSGPTKIAWLALERG